MKKHLVLAILGLTAACTGGAEHTNAWLVSKSADQAVVGIHISLLRHPEETHVLGYQKMQAIAEAACAEFGKAQAQYTGKQEKKTRGNQYDTWLERTYQCR